mmetsp:Transcript_27416/g.26215  ORF Transcript_27416/g.26215 Transcript_27416/m.26215 type:complete len:135 (+) Transcript_27416:111-515(+)|eukprot:CAMPEP_0119038288 /NCGR_PEP_ID=MMETSP1177-20130426/7102_1 /TAXON_ID=2985 /ORGANISM="Ochromonas sp, Strain CCMP1899" /LENGTH=134 /DNA_ID=CAMNT_0007000661 /DNA_START=111 /DNA_END=515 /DNA_ORIENTATION=-
MDSASSSRKIKTKGRGHTELNEEGKYDGRDGVFESVPGKGEVSSGPLQSIEGWIVFVTNVHQEAQEDDILDKFSEYGDVKNIHVNLDRRTGFVKGYALVEFDSREEAKDAIKKMNGKELLGQSVGVDWAFSSRD